ncbi:MULTISPECIES: hypothetical protein [Methylotenera]|uniref:hypothetical protein n=1 Tax=Methylotenera TaxID=359407 RepID=UPI00036EBD74|nr:MULTISPECIES: hypothetical protein [Methylotenera]
MRSTRASAAIDRLKRRSGNDNYSMAMTSNGLFSLVLAASDEAVANRAENAASNNKPSRLCEPMQMDDFVIFVNAYGPQTPKRVSKIDVAFNQQLAKSRSKSH